MGLVDYSCPGFGGGGIGCWGGAVRHGYRSITALKKKKEEENARGAASALCMCGCWWHEALEDSVVLYASLASYSYCWRPGRHPSVLSLQLIRSSLMG